MNGKTLLRQRLYNLQLTGSTIQTPGEMVRYLGAVQAQDFEMSKWAVGMRLPDVTANVVEEAITTGEIIRTHVLRPTWHYVHKDDIRWMLHLTAPYIRRQMGTYFRKLELDVAIQRKSNKIIQKALEGGKQLVRTELKEALDKAKIPTNDLRLNFLLLNAETDALICSGGRREKQITYALFDTRVPAGKEKTTDEALTTLALRFFNSHGPATLKDFTGWSGLPVTFTRKGLNMVQEQLAEHHVSGLQYWGPADGTDLEAEVLLIPNYDEYLVSYKDRQEMYNGQHDENLSRAGNPLFNNIILVDGQVAGTWKRLIKKNNIEVELNPFTPLSKKVQSKLAKAVAAYKQFIE